MSSSPIERVAAVALELGELDLEGLHQAAPVGDLGELVGRDLVGEAAHLVLELDHPLREAGGLAVLFLQARLGLLHQGLHGAALAHHLAHHAGQALERVGLLDHLGVAADALVEVAGLGTELAELGEHLVDQALQRVARLLAVDLDLGMAQPRVVQHVAHRAHAARRQAFLDLHAHRVALALDPAVVLGEVGEARGELVAELAELVEQVVAVLQHPLGAQAGGLHLLGERAGSRLRRRSRWSSWVSSRLSSRLASSCGNACCRALARLCAMPIQAASLPGASIATGVTSAASLAATSPAGTRPGRSRDPRRRPRHRRCRCPSC